MPSPGAPGLIRIAATLPLVRAGLERAATRAGFAVVPGSGMSTILLRGDAALSSEADIDVAVTEQGVTVQLHYRPDAETWQGLCRLLAELLPDGHQNSATTDTRAADHSL